jgi:hypothetical protein
MIDLEMLNMMPVNEKAREMLGTVGIEPDPASLYSVQMAKWGYEKGEIEVEASVSETIEAMFSWGPARIANFFMIDMKGNSYSPQGWREAEEPIDFARILLDDVQEKVLIHFPWYGSI